MIKRLYPILRSIPDTLFITSTSFEERCLTSIRCSKDSYSTQNIIVFDIKNPERGYYYEQERHRQEIEEYAKDICKGKTNFILCNDKNVIGGLRHFQNCLEEFQGPNPKYITIDISTFTKPYIFVILRELIRLPGNNRIRVVYTRVDYTKYGLDNIKGRFRGLSWGVERSGAIPFFEGNGIYYNKKLLITFLGFERDRAKAVLKRVKPDITYWIIGTPSDYPKKIFPTERYNREILKLYATDENKFWQNAYDPLETKEILEEICRRNPDCSITISPLGTKVQVLGIFLFALENPRISPRIFYATPVDYYDKYYTSREDTAIVDLYEFYLPTKIQLYTTYILQGYYRPFKDGQWDEILEAIRKTPPPFSTVEEAMDWIRKRR